MMHTSSFDEDPIEQLLRSLHQPVEDNGFTDRVAARLKWRRHRRSFVLAATAVLGSTITLWLLPEGYLAQTLATGVAAIESIAAADVNVIYILAGIIGAGAWLLKGEV